MLSSIKAESRNPRTIAAGILLVTTIVFMAMYLQRAESITTLQEEYSRMQSDSTAMHSITMEQKTTITTLQSSLTLTEMKLHSSDSSNSWYKRNWYKHTRIQVDPAGGSTTIIDEGTSETGGTSSASSTTKDSTTMASSSASSTKVEYITVHDTLSVTKVVTKVEYKVVYQEVVAIRPGRVYAGAGGYVDDNLAYGVKTALGFTYGFTKLTFLNFEAQHYGATSWTSGYKLAATAGLKLDF